MYGRREDTDIVNDETFGFLESSHDDRSDQERKRRGEYRLLVNFTLFWFAVPQPFWLVVPIIM